LLHNLLQNRYRADATVDLVPTLTETVLASNKTTAALASEHSVKDKPDEKFITKYGRIQISRICSFGTCLGIFVNVRQSMEGVI
jgi:transformation/transcription domain-associated protein